MTPSTPKLSEVARHLILPDGIVTSTFSVVYRRLRSVGLSFDPWQQGLGMAALGRRESGLYACTVGGVAASIPRQVGKTYTIGSLMVGLCLEFPGTRVVWTSHHTRTTTNTFRSLQSLVRRPKIFGQLAQNGIRTANGEQEIRFANGSIIMFGAREQGFGRGMDAIDFLVFDEAQILGLKALEDMVPATNQARHPHGGLVFFIGTPPRPEDPGEAFTSKRMAALAGRERNGMYVELSADPDADLDDQAQIRKANPSFPHRTPLEAMLRMRANIPSDGSWRREALGIWDEITDGTTRLISAEAWRAVQTMVPPAEPGTRSFGVAYSLDGAFVSLAGAVAHSGGVHLELVATQTQPIDHVALADWLADRWRDTAEIWITGKAGASVLHLALLDRGVPARVARIVSGEEYFAATSGLHAAVLGRQVTVPVGGVDDPLEVAVRTCDRKARGTSGAWAWVSTRPGGDPTPLEALSVALRAAKTSKRRPGRGQEVL